jgi:ribonuclease HIII
VKGEGVVATLYASGKLVVQGEDPSLFVERFVGLSVAVPKMQAASGDGAGAEDDDRLTVGSDECGKGDYFGPLVVAAVRLDAREARGVREAGVRDSKTVSDESAIRLGGALRGTVPHAVARLDPEEYTACTPGRGTERDARGPHARARARARPSGVRVVIDQFGPERLMRERLEGLDIALEQRPRAEVVPAVAAASLIAREEFLLALRELSERFGRRPPQRGRRAGRPRRATLRRAPRTRGARARREGALKKHGEGLKHAHHADVGRRERLRDARRLRGGGDPRPGRDRARAVRRCRTRAPRRTRAAPTVEPRRRLRDGDPQP